MPSLMPAGWDCPLTEAEFAVVLFRNTMSSPLPAMLGCRSRLNQLVSRPPPSTGMETPAARRQFAVSRSSAAFFYTAIDAASPSLVATGRVAFRHMNPVCKIVV